MVGERIQRDLVIIFPVYEDAESASILLQQIAIHCPGRPFIVAVEDGSLRKPLAASAISAAGLQGEVLHLKRNMGHQRAIATGIVHVSWSYEPNVVVVMDGDGEDTPESIPRLLEVLRQENVEAVVAERARRSESVGFRVFYVIYRALFQLLTGRRIRFGNFTALSSKAVRRLACMQEVWVHFAASLMVSRVRIATVPTDRGRRYVGKSQMNLVSLVLHGLRSIMVFAEDVLVRVGLVSFVLMVGSLSLLSLSVVLKLIGFATPGWFSIAAGLLLLILMQAGVLVFVTLMVTGILRSAPPLTGAEADRLIERIEVAWSEISQTELLPVTRT